LIAVDTNLLVYAHRPESPFHDLARGALTELAEGASSWAIPWPCVHEFFSIVTHAHIFKTPTPADVALAALTAWRQAPRLTFIGETEAHLESLGELVCAGAVRGPKIHDARIATICLAHGVRELWTADRDFSRFPALQTRNPLVP